MNNAIHVVRLWIVTVFCCYGFVSHAAQEKTFEGTWKSGKYPASGTFSVRLKITNDKITGSIKVTGSPMIKGGILKGTIKKNKIQFGVIMGGGIQLNYKGTIVGDKISGTYSAVSKKLKDKGTWSGARQGAERGAAGSPTGKGLKCYQSSGMTYYFKGDRIRFEKPGMVPGVVTYDLQIGDTEYYKVVIRGEAHVGKIKPSLTYDQWYKRIVLSAERAKGTPAANMPGVVRCEKADLPNDFFKVPKS